VRVAGLVEYDGTDFAGWAAQPDQRTVEGTLGGALETVLRRPVKLAVAGRTDAGVHAAGQVVSFDVDTGLPPDNIAYRTTAVLPKDVALRQCVVVPESFDARKNARSRSYEYKVVNAPVRSALRWRHTMYVARSLDYRVLRKTGELVNGTHDFRAFTPSKTYHVRFERVIEKSLWRKEGDRLTYEITADSFLYGMVRTLVGTMLEVAQDKREVEDFEQLLAGGRRTEAGFAVPARGLTLTDVGYDLDLWGDEEHG
jgi:tRNA pseudouridine38-40 synthase